MKLSKRIAALAAAMVMSVSVMGLSASAATERTDSRYIGNCRTNPDIRTSTDKEWMKLKKIYFKVSGVNTHVGNLYGRIDYDIFGDDSVQCKTTSDSYKHNAIVKTNKEAKASSNKALDIEAKTDWADLSGGNGDPGPATFYGGFFI